MAARFLVFGIFLISRSHSRRREDFPVRCDVRVVYCALVQAGYSVGAAQTVFGDADPLGERCAPFLQLPALPV